MTSAWSIAVGVMWEEAIDEEIEAGTEEAHQRLATRCLIAVGTTAAVTGLKYAQARMAGSGSAHHGGRGTGRRQR